jgi:hypothetical protein
LKRLSPHPRSCRTNQETPMKSPIQSATAVSLGTNAASLLVPTLLPLHMWSRGLRKSALMNRNDMYGGIIVAMLVFIWDLGYIQ